MENIIIPGGKNLAGNITAISSKSDLHRLIICACLADKPCKIRFNDHISKDIIATISCLEALGAVIKIENQVICIEKTIDRNNMPQNAVLDCIESGSTARFLLPVAALLCKGAVITGSGKLPERPFEQLCASLEAAGAKFSSHTLPITVEECANVNDYLEISGNVSSQYITGLLFILPLCNCPGIKVTTELESAGYVNLTIDAMCRFGIKVNYSDSIFTCTGIYNTPNCEIDAQGDWSNAAFWLCAPKTGETITVSGLSMSSSQPDRAVCDILSQMGLTVIKNKNSVIVKSTGTTKGINFDARNIPDLVPILSVRAAISEGNTVISGISRLRIKESDRVKSVCDMLSGLGVQVSYDKDHICITGCGESLKGATVDSYNDHRIAMSAAIAACFCDGNVNILGSKAVEKSYPMFYEHYKKLSNINNLETYHT